MRVITARRTQVRSRAEEAQWAARGAEGLVYVPARHRARAPAGMEAFGEARVNVDAASRAVTERRVRCAA